MNIYILSIIAGLATCFGCGVVLFFGRPTKKSLSLFMGMASGIMLAVIIFDLIPSSLEYGSIPEAATGFILGVIFMLAADMLLESIHSKSFKSGQRYLKMGYLIAIGISLHDLPEGIAIAAGYAAKENLGIIIALAIGLHNIPEGMATGAPLKMGGLRSCKILLITALVSVFTPLGTALGFVLVDLSRNLIAVLLALAGGAMSYIVKRELLPESRRGDSLYATAGGVAGFGVILALTFAH